MIQILGAALALVGMLTMGKDTLVARVPWIAERMPPGEPYGRHGGLHVFNRKAGGLVMVIFGVLLLAS